jgi:hypothetical protein
MRHLLLLTLAFMMVPSAHAGDASPVVMQTKMDPSLKNILDVLVTSMIGRFPGVNRDSKVEIDQSSSLDQGKATGVFSIGLVSTDHAPLVGAQGKIDIGLTRADTGEVNLSVVTTGTMSSQELLNAFNAFDKGLCGISTFTCKVAGADENSQPLSQQSALAFERIKSNILAYLDTLINTKKVQTFGDNPMMSDAQVQEQDATPAIAAKVRVAVEQAFKVSMENGVAIYTVDTAMIKALGDDASQQSPAVSILASFNSVELRVGDSESTVTLVAYSQLPADMVATYDAFLAAEQAKSGGLSWLNDLVAQLGPWAVGRCSTDAYRSMCIDKLFRGCVQDMGGVGRCVLEAQAIQAARGKGDEHLAVDDNGVSIFGNQAAPKAGQ